MNRTHPYFTRALLGVCLLLCLLPDGAKAQLFGGMIKTSLGTITLTPSQNYFVSSIYDTDYLPYTAPSGVATTGTQAANGLTNDPGETAVNVQGTITTTGVVVRIPCTTTGIGTIPAYSYQINFPAAMTEDGISRDLKLSWISQTYTQHSKTINATLQAVGGTINIKKLDINAGIGSDYLGVLLVQLQYPTYDSGATSTLSVRNMPGIPDKMFGLADNGGVVRHNFLYLPVTGEDGRVWLNNNLGADYANVSKPSFDPMKQSQSQDGSDYLAYGSLFQYGRKPDGHELINWTGTSNGTAVTGTTATKSDEPAHDLFITAPEIDQFWATTASVTRWAPASANMPCPSGYRIPDNTEYKEISLVIQATMWDNFSYNRLRFTSPGHRATDGTLIPSSGDWREGMYMVYPHTIPVWVNEPYYFGEVLFWGASAYLSEPCTYGVQLNGGSVRCIKN